MLRVAKENTAKCEYQYILSLNEANLMGIEDILTPEEYKELLTDNVILELTDEPNAGKLLNAPSWAWSDAETTSVFNSRPET